MRRTGLALAGLLLLPACADNLSAPTSLDSIAGAYTLTSVDGQPLPFSGASDSTGTVTTITGGTLLLGEAAPERYVATPGGLAPGSCVHEIPEGASLDGNIVHLPDGTSYQLPPCGDGPYTLVLSRQVQHPGVAPAVQADTTSGLYAWGPLPWGETKEITLMASDLEGSVTMSQAGVDIRLNKRAIGAIGPGPGDHEYGFRGGPE